MVAQTYPQLVSQLARNGTDDATLLQVASSYEFAAQLFSGRYRRSMKPFVDHLVGTASVVADHDGSDDLVLAGLLHAVYALGEFGDGGRGVSPRKRAIVRDVVGWDVEQWIVEYDEFPFTVPHLRSILEHRDKLDERDRGLTMLRLANEVDDHLDHQLELCAPIPPEQLREHVELMVEVGRAADLEELAGQLSTVASTPSLALPASIRTDYEMSVFIAPPRSPAVSRLMHDVLHSTTRFARRSARAIRRRLRPPR